MARRTLPVLPIPTALGFSELLFRLNRGRIVPSNEVSRVATTLMMYMRPVLITDVVDPSGKDRSQNNGGYLCLMESGQRQHTLIPFGLPRLETYRDAQRFALEKVRRLLRKHRSDGHVTSAQSADPDHGRYAGGVISPYSRRTRLQWLMSASGLPARADECIALGVQVHYGLITINTALGMASLGDGNVYIGPFFRRLGWW